MSRGRYAVRAAAHREQELAEALRQAHAELQAERAARAADAAQHQQALRDARSKVAAETAENVQNFLMDKVERTINGVAAVSWKAQRLALTQHLAWLFFRGYLDWDRMNGDIQVCSFIATHGDIDAWWTLTHKYGHLNSRGELRKVQKRERQHEGILSLFSIDRTVNEALSGKDRAIQEREHLNDVVARARDAFIEVELNELLIGFQSVDVTEQQVQIHREALASIDEWLNRPTARAI